MGTADIIACTTISAVWVALGGDQPRHGRAKAFYRGGDNQQAVSLDDAKGVWYDYRDGIGGGILDLIQHVLGCNRSEALKWVADFAGVEIDDHRPTPEQRREYARQRARAERKACDIEHWRRAYVAELNARKIAAAGAADDEAFERAASLCNVLENGSSEDVIREYRAHRASNPADVARLIAAGAEREAEAKRIALDAVCLIAAKCQ